MKVADVLRGFEKRGINKVMMLYRDEKGEMKSFCYQDLTFFEVIGHNEYKILAKPSEILEVINSLVDGEFKYVGKVFYSQTINLIKYLGWEDEDMKRIGLVKQSSNSFRGTKIKKREIK